MQTTTRMTQEQVFFTFLDVVVDGIARTFGSRCEVVLHDLRNPRRSVKKIVHGHVSGRDETLSIDPFKLDSLLNGAQGDMLANYPSVSTDGRYLKSTSILFRNEQGEPMTALCINIDLNDFLSFHAAIQDLVEPSDRNERDCLGEFPGEAERYPVAIVDRAIRESHKSIPSMRKGDKLRIVKELEEKGFFLTKGAVKLLTRKLGISMSSIYGYLQQTRRHKRSQ
jgi:predicted transcriptional regulator YheO